MKIYVASSWRNDLQPKVVDRLRAVGHEVYDFRNPAPGDNGFSWKEIDGGWQSWSAEKFRTVLQHPVAERGFKFDMDALRGADATVLVLPCGRSAHLELGAAVGFGQTTVVFLAGENEPELMYKMCDYICVDLGEVVNVLSLAEARLKGHWRER